MIFKGYHRWTHSHKSTKVTDPWPFAKFQSQRD
jgi:hypothetical protein